MSIRCIPYAVQASKAEPRPASANVKPKEVESMDEASRPKNPASPNKSSTDPSPIPAPPWATPRDRRPRRAARQPLDRERIVAAALAIVDAEGTEALSLRRLADALGVTPMSLYWHVRDKAELLDLVGEAVLAEIEIPPAKGDWRAQLRDVHLAMLAGFMRHPNTADLLIGRARFGSAGITLFERILAILLGRGLTPVAAFDAYQSLYLFTLGLMAMASRTPEFRQIQADGARYMRSLPADRFPSIRAVAPVIGGRTLEEQFAVCLNVQIEGVAASLAPDGEPGEQG
jgi:AcrR family transcriptional regulator